MFILCSIVANLAVVKPCSNIASRCNSSLRTVKSSGDPGNLVLVLLSSKMSPQSSACSEFDIAKSTSVFLSSPIIVDPQGFTTGFVFLPTLRCISTAVLELLLSFKGLDFLRSKVFVNILETL